MTEQKLLKLKVTNTQYLEPGLSAVKTFTTEGGTIGSGLSSDWCLKDRKGQLEATHCRIAFMDEHFCVTDESNKVFINGALMPVGWGKHARLNEGDIIVLGPYQVRVSINDEEGVQEKDLEQMLMEDDHLELFSDELSLLGAEKASSEIDDPLTALDTQKGKGTTKSLLDPVLTSSQESASLIANRHEWLGHDETVQADTERDITSAITLGKFESQLNSTHRFKQPTTQDGGFEPTPSYASEAGFISTNKDNVMDDKTLDLLDEELGHSGFSYSNSSQEWDDKENHLLTGPLFRGLGVRVGNPDDLAEMQMLSEEMGASLQASIKGLIDLHQQVNTGRYGVMNKNLQPIEDNPLRLSLGYDDTVKVMFDTQRSPVHLSAPSAIEESLRTIKDHNEAVNIAITQALTQILQAFSPEVLMRRFLRYRRSGQPMNESPEAWAWQMYQSYHHELTSNRQHGFEKLFWEIFDQSYDKNLREKQQEI